jgi:hypothetical protein
MWISCMQANVATSESPSSSKAYRVHMFAAHTFPYGARSSSSLIWSARSVPYPVRAVGSVPDYALHCATRPLRCCRTKTTRQATEAGGRTQDAGPLCSDTQRMTTGINVNTEDVLSFGYLPGGGRDTKFRSSPSLLGTRTGNNLCPCGFGSDVLRQQRSGWVRWAVLKMRSMLYSCPGVVSGDPPASARASQVQDDSGRYPCQRRPFVRKHAPEATRQDILMAQRRLVRWETQGMGF